MSLEDYEFVSVRLSRLLENLRARDLDPRVVTVLLSQPGADVCVIRAELWIGESLMATGHAEEVRGVGNVNRTSHLENCETSALGRMCESYAPTADPKKRPSNEEMQKVERANAQPIVRHDESGKVLPVKVKGKQHGPIPQWAIDDAAEQGIVEVWDNRDKLIPEKNRPWFKCVQSGTAIWAPRGTPLPHLESVSDLQDSNYIPEEPF